MGTRYYGVGVYTTTVQPSAILGESVSLLQSGLCTAIVLLLLRLPYSAIAPCFLLYRPSCLYRLYCLCCRISTIPYSD